MSHSSPTSGDPGPGSGPRRGAARAFGDLLAFCAGAQGRSLPPTDRARFVTAGVLMLLTAALATYAGATVVAVGFGVPTFEAIPYGIFYALFIFFVDRSVLLTPKPYRYDAQGNVETAGPGLSTAVRVFIAVCAALIVGETVLLRLFESSIATRVAEIRQEDAGRVLAGWDTNQESELAALTADLAAKQKGLDTADDLVTAKTAEVNCQLTGGPSCLGGAGPVYQIKLAELAAATAAVADATRLRDAAQRDLDEFRATREERRTAFADTVETTTAAANDLLIREKAFWRLTVQDRSVLVWRVVLTLLLLGVDLAPLLFKRGLDRTAYRRRERLALWREESSEEVEALQIGHTARERRELATTIAARLAGRYEDYLLRRDGIESTVRWNADAADAAVAEEEIRADRDTRLREVRRRHGYVAEPRTPASAPLSSLSPAPSVPSERPPRRPPEHDD